MNHKNIIIISVSVLLAIVVLFLMFGGAKDGQLNDSANEIPPVENSFELDNNPVDESTKSDDEAGGSSLPRPVLSKSSGNNGPIPAGILVNFTCSGAINVDCMIRLASQDGTDEILLEKQALTAPDRGAPSVLWTWKSVPGNWNVTAVVSADGYEDNQSNIQELIVE